MTRPKTQEENTLIIAKKLATIERKDTVLPLAAAVCSGVRREAPAATFHSSTGLEYTNTANSSTLFSLAAACTAPTRSGHAMDVVRRSKSQRHA